MIVQPFSHLRTCDAWLDVGLFTKEDALTSDAQIAKEMRYDCFVGAEQIHGSHTVIIRNGNEDTSQADGQITDQEDLLLITRSADCQSFVIVEPTKKVIGVLHTGWKGLLSHAIGNFYTVLQEEYGIQAFDTLIGIGPSLCRECSEFSDPAVELPGIDSKFFHGKNVDLQGIANQQLVQVGVHLENIERHPDCTRCHPEKYCTYRGDKAEVEKGFRNWVCVGKKL